MSLNIEVISARLSARDYSIVHETKKKAAHQRSNGPVLYLNKTAKHGISALIIHPEWQPKVDVLRRLAGVIVGDELYHSSNMKLFPKRVHGGGNPIGHGIPLSFADESALDRFLDFVEGRSASPEASPVTFAPETTEREASVTARIGHDRFRAELIAWWQGCAVTGLVHEALLRASHIKPWKDGSDTERLDAFNGLLLAAHLDAAFDKGLISFDDEGRLLQAGALSASDAVILGLDLPLQLRRVDERHRPYLTYHRTHVFLG